MTKTLQTKQSRGWTNDDGTVIPPHTLMRYVDENGKGGCWFATIDKAEASWRRLSKETQMPVIITIQITRPTLRERIRWYSLQAKLYAAKPFTRAMTADEWYAANCPPWAGQRAPWKF